jgi:TonB family protein
MSKKMLLSSNKASGVFIHLGILLVSIIAFNSEKVSAQTMHNTNSMPVYTGGMDALKEFIVENLHYPENAGKDDISGIVQIAFMIDTAGKVQNIKVIQGISPVYDAEAIRVTGLISGWTPGIRQGKPVNIMVRMPVEFQGGKKVAPGVITGKVTEKSNGMPVEGAFVVIKGTSIGTLTNSDGWYRLEVTGDSQYLNFFSTGYALQEIAIDYHSTINVELDPEYMIIDFNDPGN